MVHATWGYGNQKTFASFTEALSFLGSRFGHFRIEPRRTYHIANGTLVTWFMAYSGSTCVGSIYEPASNYTMAHVEALAFYQTALPADCHSRAKDYASATLSCQSSVVD